MTHALTAPGTVTDSQPRCGMAACCLKRSSDQPAGERPDALRPWSFLPSHRMQNASLPMPLLVGSRTVSAIAVASTASTALPPFIIMRKPACAASGCEVETTLRASTGMRCDGYGNCQSKGFIDMYVHSGDARIIRLPRDRYVGLAASSR